MNLAGGYDCSSLIEYISVYVTHSYRDQVYQYVGFLNTAVAYDKD